MSDSTGNTQGIRLRIRPPSSAESSAMPKPTSAASAAGVGADSRAGAAPGGDRRGVGADHIAMPQAGAVFERQQALQRLAGLDAGVAGLHGEGEAAAGEARLLRRGIGDLAPVQRKEARGLDAGAVGAERIDAQRDRLAVALVMRRPGRLPGQGLARGLDRGCVGGRARRKRGIDQRQRQADGRLLGDTDVLADQPVHIGRQLQHVGAEVLGDGEVGEEQQLVGIPIVDQRPDRDRARQRPLDRPGGDAGGQRPVDTGGLARITGVLPISVPAGGDGLAQGDGQRFASLGGAALGDQRGMHQRRLFTDLRAGRFGAGEQQEATENRRDRACDRFIVQIFAFPWPYVVSWRSSQAARRLILALFPRS